MSFKSEFVNRPPSNLEKSKLTVSIVVCALCFQLPYGSIFILFSLNKFIILYVLCSGINDRDSLLKYINQSLVGAGASFQCTLCGKTKGQKNNIMNHVESIHFPGSFTYHCNICDKTVKTKSALNLHNARYHSKKH